MQLYLHILILIANCIVYSISFYYIIKKRSNSVISIRSPILLVMNNLGGFLMTSIYICYEMMEDTYTEYKNEGVIYSLQDNKEKFHLFCKIFPNNYMVCHFLMMSCFILRCQRIIECCKINYDERMEIKEFYKKRYLFKETYYLKILFGCMTVIVFINFLLNLQFSEQDLNLIPYHFKKCMEDTKRGQFYVSLMWVIINFLEGVTLVTYTYIISINHIKQMIKLELFLFMLIWIVYPNLLRIADFVFDTDLNGGSHWTSYICCMFLWICLIINGYLPVVLSFWDTTSISYHYNPKLSNNLYLFLSNEICFYSFHDFAREKEKDLYYLNLYTKIIKYKFKYTMEADYYKVFDDAKMIYDSYFSPGTFDKYLDSKLLNKIKSTCQMLNKDECTYDMYDDALILAYESLEGTFRKYKFSEEYQLLIDNLSLNSYIQCKMSNTGLISKY